MFVTFYEMERFFLICFFLISLLFGRFGPFIIMICMKKNLIKKQKSYRMKNECYYYFFFFLLLFFFDSFFFPNYKQTSFIFGEENYFPIKLPFSIRFFFVSNCKRTNFDHLYNWILTVHINKRIVIDLICTCNEQTNKKNIRISTENENVENEFQLLVIKISNTHTH